MDFPQKSRRELLTYELPFKKNFLWIFCDYRRLKFSKFSLLPHSLLITIDQNIILNFMQQFLFTLSHITLFIKIISLFTCDFSNNSFTEDWLCIDLIYVHPKYSLKKIFCIISYNYHKSIIYYSKRYLRYAIIYIYLPT